MGNMRVAFNPEDHYGNENRKDTKIERPGFF